ncbi:hypothetical protein [Brevibacillus centrosporus]|uniref:hypothetical protein n=1 Tax=Brevibacillus centrosporus TaxID=54910 RepID=UPI003B012295
METVGQKLDGIDNHLIVAKLLGDITALSYLIQNFTECALDTRYSGFVNQIDVRIASSHEDFMDSSSERLVTEQFYLNNFRSNMVPTKREVTRLLKVKTTLLKILEDKQMDYKALAYTIETVEYKRYFLSGRNDG